MIQEYTSFISLQVFGVMPIKMMIIFTPGWIWQSDLKLGMFKLNDKILKGSSRIFHVLLVSMFAREIRIRLLLAQSPI